MISFKVFATALLGAVAFAAESPAVGKWNCMNVPVAGPESPWTLLIREDAKKLTGSLTDGSVEIPLSQIKLDGNAFTFGFQINDKPYAFQGKVDHKTLEGRYSGAEANGTLRCTKPVS
jgi:hypothetical protein